MAQQLIESLGSDGKLVLSNILDKNTGEYIQYKEIEGITDADVDGDVYIKRSGKYFLKSKHFEKGNSLVVKDIAELRSLSAKNIKLIKVGYFEKIEVLGYYERGDGGGGLFYWDAASTQDDNGGTVIESNGGADGRWKRIVKNDLNPFVFGAAPNDATIDNSESLQNFVDACAFYGQKIAQLGGSFYLNNIRLDSKHDGLTFGFGKLLKYGLSALKNELILVRDENTPFKINLENIEFEAFAQYSDDVASDDAINAGNGQRINGVSIQGTINGRLRNSTAKNLHFKGFAKSGLNLDSVENFHATNISGTQLQQHVIVAGVQYGGFEPIGTWPVDFNPSVNIDGLNAYNTNNIFDFAGTATGGITPTEGMPFAVAKLSKISGKKIRGRTKIHGWWGVEINQMSVDNEWLDNPTGYSSLSIAADAVPYLIINDYTAKGFKEGFSFANYLLGNITINNLRLKNCMTGISATGANLDLTNMIFENGFNPFYSNKASGGASFNLNGFQFKNIQKKPYVEFLTNNPGFWGGVSTITNYPITLNGYSQNFYNGFVSNLGEDNVGDNGFGYFQYLSTGKYIVTYENVHFQNPAVKKPNSIFLIGGHQTIRLINVTDYEGVATNYTLRIREPVTGEGYKAYVLARDCVFTLPTEGDRFNGTLQSLGSNYLWRDGTRLLMKSSLPESIEDFDFELNGAP